MALGWEARLSEGVGWWVVVMELMSERRSSPTNGKK
jgi:hypothetical protein